MQGQQRSVMNNQQRIEVLDARVGQEIATGRRMESRSDFQAVLVKGRRVNHILHLLLSLFTAGIWFPVWVILAITGGEKRELLQVDAYGAVIARRV